jgi:hypothetical protein
MSFLASNRGAVGATAALLAAASLGAVLLLKVRSNRKDSALELQELDDDDDEDDEGNNPDDEEELTPDLIEEIFDDLATHMQRHLQKVSVMIQQVRSQGQAVPEEQVLLYMKQEVESSLAQYEPECYARFGTDEESLKAAVHQFASDPKVKSSVLKLRSIHASVDPEGPSAKFVSEQVSSHWTIDTFLPIIPVYFDALTLCMARVTESVKEDLCTEDMSRPDVTVAIQQRFQELNTDATEEALAEHGFSMGEFSACMSKFQSDPKLAMAMRECKVKQEMVFRSLGLI